MKLLRNVSKTMLIVEFLMSVILISNGDLTTVNVTTSYSVIRYFSWVKELIKLLYRDPKHKLFP